MVAGWGVVSHQSFEAVSRSPLAVGRYLLAVGRRGFARVQRFWNRDRKGADRAPSETPRCSGTMPGAGGPRLNVRSQYPLAMGGWYVAPPLNTGKRTNTAPAMLNPTANGQQPAVKNYRR